jgi:hypothetical protein
LPYVLVGILRELEEVSEVLLHGSLNVHESHEVICIVVEVVSLKVFDVLDLGALLVVIKSKVNDVVDDL